MVLMCMEWAEADPFLNQGISRRAKHTVDSSSILEFYLFFAYLLLRFNRFTFIIYISCILIRF